MVALEVEAFKAWKLAVVDQRLVKNPVTARKRLAARLPVTVKLEAVVEPRVDEPVEEIFPAVRVVKAAS